MKVFVVVGLLQMENCDISYDVIGVYTSLETAQEIMKETHNNWADQLEVWEDCIITYRFVNNNQCLLIYKHFDKEERHFVVIEEKEVED